MSRGHVVGKLKLVAVALILAAGLKAPVAHAAGEGLLVLGVIASGDETAGVALIKASASGKTFAARTGQEIDKSVFLRRVTREYVYVEIKGKTERIRVGEQIEAPSYGPAPASGLGVAKYEGLERSGNQVRMTTALKDQILKHDLSKVLMQVAAVPYYVNGALQGFRLWDIDPGSVYEQAGFVNGDVVTSINGNQLTDVAGTIRMLQSLKDEPKVDVTFVRQGAEQTFQLVVQ
jgi:general secretion pathway protein C